MKEIAKLKITIPEKLQKTTSNYLEMSKCVEETGAIKNLGMAILINSTKSNAIYYATKPDDINLLLEHLPNDGNMYAIIINNGGHKTPAIVQKNESNKINIVIIDSLGAINRQYLRSYETEFNIFNNKHSNSLKVTYVNHLRQANHYGCGSEALHVCHAAFQIGKDFFLPYEDLTNHDTCDYLAPEIAMSSEYWGFVSRKFQKTPFPKSGLFELNHHYPEEAIINLMEPHSPSNSIQHSKTYGETRKNLYLNSLVEKHGNSISDSIPNIDEDDMINILTEVLGLKLFLNNSNSIYSSHDEQSSKAIYKLKGIYEKHTSKDGSIIEFYSHALLKNRTHLNSQIHKLKQEKRKIIVDFINNKGLDLHRLSLIMFALNDLEIKFLDINKSWDTRSADITVPIGRLFKCAGIQKTKQDKPNDSHTNRMQP